MREIVAQLVYGAQRFNMASVGSGSMSGVVADGGGEARFRPQQLEFGDAERGQFSERWILALTSRNTDRLAARVQRLTAILKAAWLNRNTDWQTTPVYFEVQAHGESEPRFALVHECPEIVGPNPLFNTAAALEGALLGQGVTIVRGPWRDSPPGTLPSRPITLAAAAGPADPIQVPIANHRDVIPITHLFNYDDSTTIFSANLFGTDSHPIWSVGGAMPAINDIHYIGNDGAGGTARAWHHAAYYIETPGDYDAEVRIEYWNGAAWVQAPADTKATTWPGGPASQVFKSAGLWLINVGALPDWATTAINGVTAYWIRLRLHAVTAFTTAPANGGTAAHVVRDPYLEVPAASLSGDASPFLLMRLEAPYGGDDDEGFPNLSRLVVGVKAGGDLDNFLSHINSGFGNPAGWAGVYGTDSAVATSPAGPDGPNGSFTAVSFATDTSMVSRVRITGTARLPAYAGSAYRIFARVQQIGGAAGDTRVRLRIGLRSNALADPKIDTDTAVLAGVGQGLEVVEFTQRGKLIYLPFIGPLTDADAVGLDLIFDIFAQRTAGAATLRIYDLILIPVSRSPLELDDPITNRATGSSALRGETALDVDSGILGLRTLKMIRDPVGGEYSPSEGWTRGGLPLRLRPNERARLFFLMMHYPAGGQWGTGPLIGTLGMQLTASIYAQMTYLHLRGEA